MAAKAKSQPKRGTKAKKKKFEERDVTGLKYFDQLAPLLERLHDASCERDRAGNRTLPYDQYCMLVLLYLFHPIVTSLRGVQQANELKNVQKNSDARKDSGRHSGRHPEGGPGVAYR